MLLLDGLPHELAGLGDIADLRRSPDQAALPGEPHVDVHVLN